MTKSSMPRMAAALLALAAGASPLLAQDGGAGLAPPDGLWAAQTSPTQITLSWTHAFGAKAYLVACGVGDVPPRPLGTVGAPASASPEEAARQRLTYFVRVSGSIPHRCSVQARADGAPPTAPVHFNEVVPLAPGSPAPSREPPASVTAVETADGAVVLTWTQVPGATAYMIGRSVAPDGLRTLCQLCPTETTLVDREATPGARHLYTVAAVTPLGVSRRTSSNELTPGSAPAAGAGGASGTGGSTSGESTSGGSASGGSSSGGATSGGTTAGGGTASGGTAGGAAGGQRLPPAPPVNARAMRAGPAAVMVSWQPPAPNPDGEPINYLIRRSVDGDVFGVVGRVGESTLYWEDDLHPLLSAGGTAPLRLVYEVQAIDPDGPSAPVRAGELQVERSGAAPETKGPAAAPQACTLEYQRADNMFAGVGRPDGALGLESVTVAAGQTKVFTTDWKYEKQRNDGTNYYGSHLRVATNRGQLPVALHLRGGSGMVNVREFTLQPGERKEYRHDLMEVTCTPAR